MSVDKKSVSALVPVHNGERWLKVIFAQLEANLKSGDEIIFVENGSTDSSLEILKSWKSSLPVEVLSLRHPNLVEALNLGVSASSNNWIARFDVDDSYSSVRIEKQRELMSEDVSAIFTDYRMLGNGKIKLGRIYSPVFPRATLISLINSQRTAHPSSIFNKEAFLQVGGYVDDDFPAEDLSLWLRLAKIGSLVSAPIIGLDYNLRANSVSSAGQQLALQKKDKLLRNALLDLNLWKEIDSESLLEEMDRCYKRVGNGFERALLLLWDLKKLLPLLGRQPITLENNLKVLSGNSSILNRVFCASRLIIEREARRVFRTLRV